MRQVKQNIIQLFSLLFLILCCSVNAFSATVSGTITLETGGHPGTGDITILLLTKDPNTTSGCHASTEASATSSYNSDTGAFTLSDISAGSYYLKVDNSTGVNLVREWAIGANADSSQDCSQAVIITVSENDNLTDYNFELGPGGTISGFVKNDDGTEALGSVQVQVVLQQLSLIHI